MPTLKIDGQAVKVQRIETAPGTYGGFQTWCTGPFQTGSIHSRHDLPTSDMTNGHSFKFRTNGHTYEGTK